MNKADKIKKIIDKLKTKFGKKFVERIIGNFANTNDAIELDIILRRLIEMSTSHVPLNQIEDKKTIEELAKCYDDKNNTFNFECVYKVLFGNISDNVVFIKENY